MQLTAHVMLLTMDKHYQVLIIQLGLMFNTGTPTHLICFQNRIGTLVTYCDS
jgi:hypothetical protein